MKCGYCGYEIVKPNLKTCPLCGKKLTPGDMLSEEQHGSSEPAPVETEIPGNVETEHPATRNVESQHDADTVPEETGFEPSHDAPRHENAASYSNPPVHDSSPYRANPEPINNRVEHSDPQPTGHYPQKNVTPEDPDQYMENGSYQPYPDEVEDAGYDDGQIKQSEGQSSAWVITAIAAIAGLVIGSILYFAIG